jgi:hypothetical protein
MNTMPHVTECLLRSGCKLDKTFRPKYYKRLWAGARGALYPTHHAHGHLKTFSSERQPASDAFVSRHGVV